MLPRAKFGALPYQNTPTKHISTALKLITKHTTTPLSGSSFIDLGSGLGEATLQAAPHFAKSYGVEINPTLLYASKFKAWRAGTPNAFFSSDNLVTLPLSPYHVIFMFGVKPLLQTLTPKLRTEVKKDSLVVLYRFKLGTELIDEKHFEIVEREGEITVYRRL